MARQAGVAVLVDLVEHQVDEVEAGEQRRGQLEVVHHGALRVPARLDRVGRRQHRRAGVQARHDAGLCDRDRLLLHSLMQDGAGDVVHLVELINAANATVGQHQGTRLQHQLARFRVANHVRRETNGGRALAAGVNAARGDLVHVGEQLRLAGTRITAQQHVDLTAHLPLLPEVLVCATEQHAQQSLLHVVHLPDRRCQRARQLLVHIGVLADRLHARAHGLRADGAGPLRERRGKLRARLCRRLLRRQARLVRLLHVEDIQVRGIY
mmetsp:Transcript_177622/g.432143  ORF Transcript_177622/g.432143 Transcript_177622/m.432143 type:complete len:267 (+) Transcript_177622:779-1579(+)